MRHRVAGRRLSRTSEHRLAMRRNLVSSLFEHETVSTTIEKAKDAKPFAEKMVTLAKKGTLAARRRAIALLGDRDIVENEDNKPVKKGTVIGKLFSDIGPRYLDRPGGYTRIIRLSLKRLGDNGSVVLFQLIGKQEKAGKEKTKKQKADKTKDTNETVEVQDIPEAEVATEQEQESLTDKSEDSKEEDKKQTQEDDNPQEKAVEEKDSDKEDKQEKLEDK